MKWDELVETHQFLEAQRQNLLREGECLRGCWLDSSVSRGKRYYRLRFLSNGQVGCQKVDCQDLSEIRAALERGKRLAEVERRLNKIGAKMDAIAATAHSLGLHLRL